MPITDYRVLLVEDEYEIAEMLAIFFHGRGFFLFHAGTGQEALKRAPAILPHVILMDVSLPDLDGFEITKRLRQMPRTSHIPVIFLTRRGGREDRLAGLELGADDFISKPFDLEELVLRIKNSVYRAEREMQTEPHTGLPSVRAVRGVVDVARANPQISAVEFHVNEMERYRRLYGAEGATLLFVQVAEMMKRTMLDLGHLDDFIGYIDEERYLILCHQDEIDILSTRIVVTFNAAAAKLYDDTDLRDGQVLIDGILHPLISLSYRTLNQQERLPE